MPKKSAKSQKKKTKEKRIISIKKLTSRIKKVEAEKEEKAEVEEKNLEEALEKVEDEERQETTLAHSLQPIDIPNTTLKSEGRTRQVAGEEPANLEEGVADAPATTEGTGRERGDYQIATPGEGYDTISPKYDEDRTTESETRDLLIRGGRTVDIENIPTRFDNFQRTEFVVNPELREFRQPRNPEDYRVKETERTFQRDEFQRQGENGVRNHERQERKYREKK